MKKLRKAVPISYLNSGDNFEFVNLLNFRNCKIKRNSDCGTSISGEHKHGEDESWKPLSLGYVISNSAEVYLIE